MLSQECITPSNSVEQFLVDREFFDDYARLCGWKATLVYLVLCLHPDCPSIESLAYCLAISVNSVKRGLQELRRWHIVEVVRRKDARGRWEAGSFTLSDKSEWLRPDNDAGFVAHEVMHKASTVQPRLCGVSGWKAIAGHSSVESEFSEFANKTHSSVRSLARVSIYNIYKYNYNNIFNNKINYKYYGIEYLESNLVLTERIRKEKREKLKKREEKFEGCGKVEHKSPAQVMENFLDACRGQDARYLRLLRILEQKGIPCELAQQELTKFCRYWTERNSTGMKARWELEKTFELPHRLSNWFNNLRRFQREKKGIKLS
jgi:hypothetical protein